MRLHEVDLPQALIDAEKRGKLVIFAGAGASMDSPSNYPDFSELAERIGGTSHPRYSKEELIDRYLGRLEQTGLPVHKRVQQILSDPESRPNHIHRTIVRLFGSADSLRIVTTNFDDHFSTASSDAFGAFPKVHSAPALPLGDEFRGIVHLHGSVLEEAKTLVLTDADFGRAYLTQGWARQFVQRLFAEFVVLFIGYSHQDLPLLYLARGISAAAGGPGRYVLTASGDDTFWLNLGITPVHYPLRDDPKIEHEALGECLTRWADIANLGSLATESRVREIVTCERPLTQEEYDFIKQAFLDVRTLRYFTRHARAVDWLYWASEMADFEAMFATENGADERAVELAVWYADHFVIPHFGAALEIVRRKGGKLSWTLWHQIAVSFHRHQTAGKALRQWLPILLSTMPARANSDFLAYMVKHCTMPDDRDCVIQIFRKLTEPTVSLRQRFLSQDDGRETPPDMEVTPRGSDHWVSDIYRSHILPNQDVFARDLAIAVTSAFEDARAALVTYGKAGPSWDPISHSRGAVSSRIQDHLRNAFSVLIDAGADVLKWANEKDSDLFHALVTLWITSKAPILRRLAIAGMAGDSRSTSDSILSWAISKKIVENYELKNETFALLARAYGMARKELRAELVDQAECQITDAADDRQLYPFFNLMSWLHAHAPDCDIVQSKLSAIREKHPEWREREHPDFNSWMSGGVRQLVPDSPIPASQIQEMNLEALSFECTRLAEVKDMFGDSMKVGFLQEVSRTSSSNFAWSERIALEAINAKFTDAELWSALLRGWNGKHGESEWHSLLHIIVQLKPAYEGLSYELAILLKGAVDENGGGLPRANLADAVAVADALLEVLIKTEPALPETSNEWVSIAINRNSGYLLEFYFDAVRLLWQTRDEEVAQISSLLETLEIVLASESPASELARILVPAHALLFSAIDTAWYESHVLPLLAQVKDLRASEQSWDGYLVWGRWSQETLPGILQSYLDHLPAIVSGVDERSSMYCSHLAGIAVFGSVNPIDSAWLDQFLGMSMKRERLEWIGSVSQSLRGADSTVTDSVWNRWLLRYWERRIEGTPIPLDSEETGAMCEWALILRTHYVEIVELLLSGPTPSVKRNMFYYRLHEAELMDEAPSATVKFLTALLSQEDGTELWDWDQIHALVERAIELNPENGDLRPLLEEIGRLGSNRALELGERLTS